MSARSMTAAAARRELLDPSMDARALNLEQSSLIYNPTLAADSLVEHLEQAIGRLGSDPDLEAALRLAREILESNGSEGECECAVAGAADELVRTLRSAELRGASEAITAKAIARRLREPLSVLSAVGKHDAAAIVTAAQVLAQVTAIAPRSQLLAPAVEHELGARKFAALQAHISTEVTQ